MASKNSVFWECFKAIATWHILGSVVGLIAVLVLRGYLVGGGCHGGCGGGHHKGRHHGYEPEMYEMYEGDEYY